MRSMMITFLLYGLCHVGLAQDAQAIAEAAKAQGVDVTPQQVQKALEAAKPAEQPGAEQPAAQPRPEVQPEAAELSSIEQLLSGRMPADVSKNLRQFGYDVFRRAVTTFAPLTNVPVGPDYVVGPGDSFTITMWGRQNDQITVTVDRDGKIALPQVGVLSVSGMTFARLQEYLDNELRRKFQDFKMHLTMGRLRTITIYVVGEASAPGSYTLSALSTVINALFACGGPTSNGTLRNVRLLRSGSQPVVLDLYDFLLGGDKSRDVRLTDGDTIHIPLIGPVVGVAGNVKRPAIYEMARPMTLKEVLELAGGVTYAGWLQHIQVERVEAHTRRIVVDFDLSRATEHDSPELATMIQDGDLVKVFRVIDLEQNVVYLEGHAVRPGKYQLKPGMRLSHMLDYQTFLPQVNMEYAEVERLVPPDMQPVIIPFRLGRVLEGDQSEDLQLERFDRIRLFRWDQKGKRSVTISGRVYQPGEYRCIEGMRVKDLIDMSGGLQKDAYLRSAELIRTYISQDGMTTERIDIDLEKALASDPAHDIQLQDYDRLVVRAVPEIHAIGSVTITGEVRFPGTYPIQKGERLSSLIERAGGFTDKAYLKAAVFTRQSARAIQQQRVDDMIRQLEQYLLTTASAEAQAAVASDTETAQMQQLTIAARKELLNKLRAARIDGRVVIRLEQLDRFKGSKYDIELEDGDHLIVPQQPGTVNVVGEVFNPTSLVCEPGRTVGFYLNKVGGLTKDADRRYVYVIRADGSVISMAQQASQRISWDGENRIWRFGNFMSVPLDPGDTIIVPRKLDKVPWIKTTKDITQILFQIAVAAGVVLAI